MPEKYLVRNFVGDQVHCPVCGLPVALVKVNRLPWAHQ
jgi:hypothetical protein